MATQPGKIFNFQRTHLVIFPGFRVDAYDVGGVSIAWQGDDTTVSIGPDNIPVFISTGNAYAIPTVNLSNASDAIDFIHTWIEGGDTKVLSWKDSNARTFLTTQTARPRQRANMTYNGSSNPAVYDIHCPNFRGPVGGLDNP